MAETVDTIRYLRAAIKADENHLENAPLGPMQKKRLAAKIRRQKESLKRLNFEKRMRRAREEYATCPSCGLPMRIEYDFMGRHIDKCPDCGVGQVRARLVPAQVVRDVNRLAAEEREMRVRKKGAC